MSDTPYSTEGERVSLHPRVEKLDGESAIDDRPGLADELIKPVVGHNTLALGVNVGPTALSGRGAVDRHAETHWLCVCSGAQHQMQIAGVEPIRNSAVSRIERR